MFANMKREGKDFSGKVTPLFDSMLVQATEEEKRGRKAETAHANYPSKRRSTETEKWVISLKRWSGAVEDHRAYKIQEICTSRRSYSSNAGLYVRSVVDVASSEKNEQSTKLGDSTAGDSAAPTIQVSTAGIGEVTTAKIDELTLAQTLIEIKAAKPKVVTTAATTTTTITTKGKGVVITGEVVHEFPLEVQPLISKDKGKEEGESSRGAQLNGSRKKMLGGKRAEKQQHQESSKKQKMKEDKESNKVEEVSEDDEGELLKHLLIRADGSSKRYSSMIRMLQRIDREDLEVLWRIVKAKHNDTCFEVD
ncbi:hypothetical protein Tco_0212170 [Tanacetum coccineum]